MQKVQQAIKSKKGLVLGVALQGDTSTAIKQFRTRNKVSYPIAIDAGNKFGRFIEGIPLTVVVDRKGIIQEVHDGFDVTTHAKLKTRYLQMLSGK